MRLAAFRQELRGLDRKRRRRAQTSSLAPAHCAELGITASGSPLDACVKGDTELPSHNTKTFKRHSVRDLLFLIPAANVGSLMGKPATSPGLEGPRSFGRSRVRCGKSIGHSVARVRRIAA